MQHTWLRLRAGFICSYWTPNQEAMDPSYRYVVFIQNSEKVQLLLPKGRLSSPLKAGRKARTVRWERYEAYRVLPLTISKGVSFNVQKVPYRSIIIDILGGYEEVSEVFVRVTWRAIVSL